MKQNCNCGYIPEPPFKGASGLTPFIGKNGNWWIGLNDTGVKAEGTDGITPHIGANGNWFIGTTDTGVSATGAPGASATIAVGTTTTLAAGSAATVVNAGTASAAVFNFGIPQGVAGTGGGSNLIHASFYGILLNDADQPSTVSPGAKIPWKILNNNGTGLITTPVATPYFQFTKTGRYMCVFSLRCATKVSGDNGVAVWGIESQLIKKQLVASASAFVTPNMTNIAGTGFFDVTDLSERYNFINNSKMSLQCQGSTSAQNANNSFKDLNGVNEVDGMSCTLLRVGDAFPVV